MLKAITAVGKTIAKSASRRARRKNKIAFAGPVMPVQNAISKPVAVGRPAKVFKRESEPSTYGFTFRNTVPSVLHVKSGVRFRHTEYVADISSGATVNQFACAGYGINPANAVLFPWLSGEADAFSAYKFNSLSFHLKSLQSTSTSGFVGLSSTPDANDLIPVSKSIFLNYENASRANVWESCSHVVPQDVLNRLPEFLTSSTTTLPVSASTAMTGALYIANTFAQASAPISELYVTYDVTLLHPQDHSGFGADVAASGTLAAPFAGGVTVVGNLNVSSGSFPSGTASTQLMKVDRGGSFLLNFEQAGTGFTLQPTTFIILNSSGVNISAAPGIELALLTDALGTLFATVTYRITGVPSPWWLQTNGFTATTITATTVNLAKTYSLAGTEIPLLKSPKQLDTPHVTSEYVLVKQK